MKTFVDRQTSLKGRIQRELTIELQSAHCRQDWVAVSIVRPLPQHLDRSFIKQLRGRDAAQYSSSVHTTWAYQEIFEASTLRVKS